MFPEISSAQKKIDRPDSERSTQFVGIREKGYGLNFMNTAPNGGRVIGRE
jgi:hypothetical protein